jgi:hypothetical protein
VAKRTGPLDPADGHAPTVADNTLTAAGMVVGTVGYMSRAGDGRKSTTGATSSPSAFRSTRC